MQRDSNILARDGGGTLHILGEHGGIEADGELMLAGGRLQGGREGAVLLGIGLVIEELNQRIFGGEQEGLAIDEDEAAPEVLIEIVEMASIEFFAQAERFR